MRLKSIYSSGLNKRASVKDPLLINFRLSKRGQFFILSAVIMASIIVSLASVKNYVSTGDAPKKFYYYSQQLEGETGAVVDYALYMDPTGNNPGVKNNMNDFLQKGIEQTLAGYPSMEIIACFSNSADPTKMICQNNGTNVVNITAGSYKKDLSGNRMKTITQSVGGGGSCGSIYDEEEESYLAFFCPSTLCCLDSSTNSCGVCSSTGGVETIGCPLGATCVDSQIPVSGLTSILVQTTTGSYEIPVSASQIQRGQFYFIFKLNTTSGDYVASSKGNK